MNRLIKFWTSLRLTVVLLAFAILLVFVGTVAQADEGLFQAQTQYFKSFFVGVSLHPFQFTGISMFGLRIPVVLPGGYLIGFMLLINLIAAQVARFQFTRKKLGIYIAHAGIILLLVGQLTTDILSRETVMQLYEGQTKSYAESPSNYELVFSTPTDGNQDEEIVIPGRVLARGGEIKNAALPFSIRVQNYWHNSIASFRAPMIQTGPPLTTNGIAQDFDFARTADTKRMDDKNVPTALIEIAVSNGSLGEWVASGWSGDDTLVSSLWRSYAGQMGAQMAEKIVTRILQPQSFEAGGKKYSFTLRPERVYMPYSLTLLKATHSVYPGTDIPKDFRSRVRLDNANTDEHREVEIYMNEPLRYAGLTFYQYQMDAGAETRQEGRTASSAFQVVRNPGWLTPYIGCILVAAGLVIQFMYHLVGFVGKRKSSAAQPASKPSPQKTSVARAERRAQPQENVRS